MRRRYITALKSVFGRLQALSSVLRHFAAVRNYSARCLSIFAAASIWAARVQFGVQGSSWLVIRRAARRSPIAPRYPPRDRHQAPCSWSSRLEIASSSPSNRSISRSSGAISGGFEHPRTRLNREGGSTGGSMEDPTIVASDRAEIHMTAFMRKQLRAVTVPRSRCSSAAGAARRRGGTTACAREGQRHLPSQQPTLIEYPSASPARV
jgi:hypothetical protein